MKSTQIAFVDLERGRIVTSADYTGMTKIGPMEISSTRSEFSVIVTNTNKVMDVHMVGSKLLLVLKLCLI